MYHERIVESIEKTYEPDKNYVMITADTAADIPDPAEHPEWEVGSELVVLENGGSKYQLSNAREWVSVNFNSGGGGDSAKLQEELDKAKATLNSVIERSVTEIRSDVTCIEANAFNCCAALTTADFPAATRIGNSAFSSCTALTTANFPLVTSVGSNAFDYCTVLTEVNFPLLTEIGMYAFNRCAALTTADFPSATSIDMSVFVDCAALTTVNFPLLTSIGRYAFRNCKALTALILRANTICTLASTDDFYSTPIASGTGYIYVPASLVDTYKSATNWSKYANQFRAIEDYPEMCG